MTDTALALIEPKNLSTYFAPQGLDPIIEKIRAEVTGIVPDISTEKGRKEIASLAYKVAKSKTALDEMGKQLVSGMKQQVKAIDAERSRAWDALEGIQKEVRAPLTEWESKEKDRVAGHEAALAAIPEHPAYGQHESAAELGARLTCLENLPPRDWQEFTARATKMMADEIERMKVLLATAQKREAEQAELARLRQEEAERQVREREERIQAEAAAKAQADAEAKARAEAEAEAARVREEQEKAEKERQRLQREKEEADRLASEAEARAVKAEQERLAAVAQAELDRKAAEEKAVADAQASAEKAKQDADLAAQREREKIEAERKAEADATAKREADKAHRGKINSEALAALLAIGLSPDSSKRMIEAIAKGQIPHVKICY